MTTTTDLLSLADVARQTGTHLVHVQQWVRNGLPVVRTPRGVRVRQADLDDHLEGTT